MVLHTKQKNALAFLVPLLLLGTLFTLNNIIQLSSNQAIFYNAIVFDVILVIPLIYFLLIRKTSIPKITIVPILMLGVITASYSIPFEHQLLLSTLKTWMIPLIEVFVLTFIGFSMYKIVKTFNVNKTRSFDFYTVLKIATNQIMPKRLANLFAMEIATCYYGFFNWKKTNLKINEFTYHKNSGTITFLGALIFLISIETVAFHLLLNKWSNLAAWILTIISIYSGIQIFGILKSILKRPIAIEKNILHLRYGIMAETSIPINSIETIEYISKSMEFDKFTRRLSPFGDMESYNVILQLKDEHILYGFYGIKKPYKTITFYIDQIDAFKKLLEKQLNK